MESQALISQVALQSYLQERFGPGASLLRFGLLATVESEKTDKSYGYGEPLLVEFELDGKPHKAVLSTTKPGPFGHEFMEDRALGCLFSHRTFCRLPSHAKCLDVGFLESDGGIRSAGKAEEFFILTEFVIGEPYIRDWQAISAGKPLEELDWQRLSVLAKCLAEIHAEKLPDADPEIYRRAIRYLVGGSECLFGLTDSYPVPYEFIDAALLEKIEKLAVHWRWRLRDKNHRLCRVHGDFHMYNILFEEGTKFWLLDRSRQEYSDPAEDVACFCINFIQLALIQTGKFSGPFAELWDQFWDEYLSYTKDTEIFEVIAPFLAFRGVVVASPVWYPNISTDVRRKLFNFIVNVLEAERFDVGAVGSYL